MTTEKNINIPMIDCEGWWNQIGLGDQPMSPLQISIDHGKVEGTGQDVIGMFSLRGWIGEGKQFIL